MPTKQEAQPKVPAEAAPVNEDDRKRAGASANDEAKDEESVAPPLPTSREPRRSGAV